jgi:hypothetical protein
MPHGVAQLAVAQLAAACREAHPFDRVGPVYFVFRLDERALSRALGARGR